MNPKIIIVMLLLMACVGQASADSVAFTKPQYLVIEYLEVTFTVTQASTIEIYNSNSERIFYESVSYGTFTRAVAHNSIMGSYTAILTNPTNIYSAFASVVTELTPTKTITFKVVGDGKTEIYRNDIFIDQATATNQKTVVFSVGDSITLLSYPYIGQTYVNQCWFVLGICISYSSFTDTIQGGANELVTTTFSAIPTPTPTPIPGIVNVTSMTIDQYDITGITIHVTTTGAGLVGLDINTDRVYTKDVLSTDTGFGYSTTLALNTTNWICANDGTDLLCKSITIGTPVFNFSAIRFDVLGTGNGVMNIYKNGVNEGIIYNSDSRVVLYHVGDSLYFTLTPIDNSVFTQMCALPSNVCYNSTSYNRTVSNVTDTQFIAYFNGTNIITPTPTPWSSSTNYTGLYSDTWMKRNDQSDSLCLNMDYCTSVVGLGVVNDDTRVLLALVFILIAMAFGTGISRGNFGVGVIFGLLPYCYFAYLTMVTQCGEYIPLWVTVFVALVIGIKMRWFN